MQISAGILGDLNESFPYYIEVPRGFIGSYSVVPIALSEETEDGLNSFIQDVYELVQFYYPDRGLKDLLRFKYREKVYSEIHCSRAERDACLKCKDLHRPYGSVRDAERIVEAAW